MNWLDIYKQGEVSALTVVELGEMSVRGDFVAVRAITASEVYGAGREGGLARPDNADALAETICFEVVGVGPDVPPGVKIGDHCEFIASTADALQAFGGGEASTLFFVRSSWIPCTWDPRAVATKIGRRKEEIRAKIVAAAAENDAARMEIEEERANLVAARS